MCIPPSPFSHRFDIDIEPLFVSIALYDCKERKKVIKCYPLNDCAGLNVQLYFACNRTVCSKETCPTGQNRSFHYQIDFQSASSRVVTPILPSLFSELQSGLIDHYNSQWINPV